jgi:hypothetical protein
MELESCFLGVSHKMEEQAKQKVKELVERFRYNIDVYKKSTYNETQVRREFIDPFFEALGWDVSNKQGHAEQYKEVVHDKSGAFDQSTGLQFQNRRSEEVLCRSEETRGEHKRGHKPVIPAETVAL